MKRTILLLLFFIGSQWVNSQELTPAFKNGEWLKFRLHYSFLNASYATLHLTKKNMGGRDLFHVVANGKTTGFASIFFKVDDTYQTYFTPKDIAPIKFKREVNEGGYTMDLEVDFDHKKQTAVLWDKKKDTLYNFKIKKGVQDIVSAFYYLRNKVSLSDLKVGDFTVISMLFDDDGVFPFKLEYLGKEVLNTKFGKVSCLKFRPYVQSGRVFEAQESITLWVSNDDNKIPIRIKADIAVGSIKADLDGYNGLRNQFKIIMD